MSGHRPCGSTVRCEPIGRLACLEPAGHTGKHRWWVQWGDLELDACLDCGHPKSEAGAPGICAAWHTGRTA